MLTRRKVDAARMHVPALDGMTKDARGHVSDEGCKNCKVVESGFEYKMLDIQAAMGIHQLVRVERNRQTCLKQRTRREHASIRVLLPEAKFVLSAHSSCVGAH